jgi:hypothetical protein
VQIRRRSLALGIAAMVVIVAAGAIVAVQLSRDDETVATDGGDANPEPGGTAVLLAAGDIAECDAQGDEATAKILDAHPDAVVATLGDNAYQEGTIEDFRRCYDPSWGRHKGRTRPATGNHDHSTKDAAGYHDYFGTAGGPADRYYYSYDLGGWHVVVLNSDCWRIGGCTTGDPQLRWLRDDLADHPAECTLAYWHRPPFSSGRYGDERDTERVRPLWETVHELGVDVVLVGHEHSYERLASMDAAGNRDPEGVPVFIVGTGGGNLRSFGGPPLETTEVRNGDTWGVLRLTLGDGRYDFEFIPVEGATFTDAGSGTCR